MLFFTGFPGFLAYELIARFLKEKPLASFGCLIQPKFKELAQSKIEALSRHTPDASKRILLIEGDITLPGLGISEIAKPTAISEIYHLAAIYDLNVEEGPAKKVNVKGTRNVLDFAKGFRALERFQYVSTCYVSGKHAGVFRESDLEVGQSFNNFYESTKYEAEKLVREEMKAGLPATIYRPSIVVGNSHTGETQKFDGPYFVMQWLLRQSSYAVLPKLSNPEDFTINLVPSDYVVDTMTFLSQQKESIGKTFQLADPSPLTIADVTLCIADACERKLITVPIPKSLAKFALGSIPGVEKWLGIPRSSLDYFVHPTHYDVTETLKALSSTDIHCPPFTSYAKTLVKFMKEHREIRSQALS